MLRKVMLQDKKIVLIYFLAIFSMEFWFCSSEVLSTSHSTENPPGTYLEERDVFRTQPNISERAFSQKRVHYVDLKISLYVSAHMKRIP